MTSLTAIQLTFDGLLLGGVYAALGIGLNLIFGIMRVVNLTHGDLMVLGSYLAFTLFTAFGTSPLLSLVPGAVIIFAIGWGLQTAFFGRLREDNQREVLSLLLAFGLSSVIQNIILVVWGGDFRSVPLYTGSWHLGSIAFQKVHAVAFLFALTFTAVTWLLLHRTDFGLALRAASQQSSGARVCGVDVERVRRLAFGVGSALAGMVGALIVLMYAVSPQIGSDYVLKAFAIIVVGGLGSFPGALLGGALIGLGETFGGYFFGGNMSSIVSFVLLILVLLIKPSGILGTQRA